MLILRFLFERSSARVIASMVAGLAGGVASAAGLAMIEPALRATGASDSAVWVFGLLSGASVVLTVASEHLASIQSHDVLLDLRQQLASRIVATPLVRIEQLGAARLLTLLTDDALAVATALPGLALLCPQVAIVLGCFVYMFVLSPAGFLIVVGMTLIGLLVYTLPQRLAVDAVKANRRAADTLAGIFRALIEGIKQLQVHAPRTEHLLEQRLAPAARASRQSAVRAFGLYLIGNNLGRASFLAAIFAVLLAGPHIGAPRSVMTAFALGILFLSRPIELILSWIPAIDRAQVALSQIRRVGLDLAAPAAAVPVRAPSAGTQRIELRQVAYTHRAPGADGFAVGPLDLTLAAGEIVLLVGGNGSGKTTLAKLLVGLYPPDAGEILVDGRPVNDMPAYRANFSVVFADSFAFDDLAVGASGQHAAATAAAMGLDSLHVLNDAAPHTLSHGQRKRRLLLGSLLEDRPVYVFDEWAAEQDPVFRELFYTSILPALRAKGKAILVITHDEHYFHVGDRLLRLDYGKLEGAADGPRATSALA